MTNPTPSTEPSGAVPTAKALRPIRWWPAATVCGVAWGVLFVPAWLAPRTEFQFQSFLLTPMAALVGVGLWWLFLSRASMSERIYALLILGAAGGVAFVLLHSSMMMAFFVYAIPLAATAFSFGVAVFSWLTNSWRTAAPIVCAVVPLLYANLLRMDGITGSLTANLVWRWSPTSEELLLSSSERTSSDQGKNEPAQPERKHLAEQAVVQEGDWPGFRGSLRDGKVYGVKLSPDWQASPPREIWRNKMGPGWGSFCVVGSRLFTMEQRGKHELVKCYEAATGAPQWEYAIETRFEEGMAGPGPRSTPTFKDGKLYSVGANGHIACLDAVTGAPIWTRELLADAQGKKPPEWGFAASPLVVDGLVIVQTGHGTLASAIAYEAATGEIRWKFEGFGNHSYTSAHAFPGSPQQAAIVTNQGMAMLNTNDGTVLWKYEWPIPTVPRVTQPIRLSETSYVFASGYGYGACRIEIDETRSEPKEIWTSTHLKPYFNDFCEHKGFIYGFDDKIFQCLDTKNGKRKWREPGRFDFGQMILLADADQILVTTEKGMVVLLEARPDKLSILGEFQAVTGKTWNHPVLCRNRLYVRNGAEAVCYELSTDDDKLRSP